MYSSLFGLLIIPGLFLGMLGCFVIGKAYALWQARGNLKKAQADIPLVEGAVFAFMGLLVAFTFSGALVKFDNFRMLIIDESNAIGTAYLRLDLLPRDSRIQLQNGFKRYLDARVDSYQHLDDEKTIQTNLIRTQKMGQELWDQATSVCMTIQNGMPCILLLPAINSMLDIANTRNLTNYIHPHIIIFILLMVVSLLTATLAGYSKPERKVTKSLDMIIYAAIMAISIYVIIDMDHPRLGLIHLAKFDQVLIELQQNLTIAK